MTSFQQLRIKVMAIEKLLSREPVFHIEDSEIQKALIWLEELHQKLKKYYKFPKGPTKKDLATAKANPVSAKIVTFTTIDKERKQFFNFDYFKKKFQDLPEDRKAVSTALSSEETASKYLDALLLYYYWKGRPSHEQSLDELLKVLEKDYRSNPAGHRIEEAKGLFRKLLSEKTIGKVVAKLQTNFPSEVELKTFAKLTNLKIPAPEKGKAAPKKNMHQRLAKEIFNQGALVRMDLSK